MELILNKKKGKCKVKFCRRPARQVITTAGNISYNSLCHTCQSRKRKQADPEAYFYYKIRSNAARRLIEFTLTLDEFRKFCYDTNYITRKGRTSGYCGIDRINPNLGYVVGNIQVLEVGENSRKAMADRAVQVKYMRVEDVPF